MKPPQVIVCFGIPEPQVDEMIEATRDTPFESTRWIVFGCNITRLGGLVAQWEGVKLNVVLVPHLDVDIQGAASLILANENIEIAECIWLQCDDPTCPLPMLERTARIAHECASDDFLNLLHRLASTDGPQSI